MNSAAPQDNILDVLPKLSYAKCGFSPVEGSAVSVFASYFDESGTHNKQFLVIAGYTAEVDKWADFSNRWTALLAEHKISHLHMKAFRQNGSKAFAHLSGPERTRLLANLIGIIKETALFGTYSIVSPSYYDRMTTPRYRSDFGTAFAVSGVGVAAISVAKVQELRPGNNRVGIFFERGHKNVEQALDLIRFRQEELEELDITGFDKIGVLPGVNKHICPPGDPLRKNTAKIGAIGTGTKLAMPPLQAADILAYCVYSVLVHKDECCGQIIDQIDAAVPHYFTHLSPEKIAKMVEGTLDAEEKWGQFNKDVYRFSKGLRRTGIEIVYEANSLGIRSANPISKDIQDRFLGLLKTRL